eukprot:12899222-Prorocentrum_lima.AAC.1
MPSKVPQTKVGLAKWLGEYYSKLYMAVKLGCIGAKSNYACADRCCGEGDPHRSTYQASVVRQGYPALLEEPTQHVG